MLLVVNILLFLIYAYFALIFNDKYLHYANTEINKIKENTSDRQEQLAIATKKGGVDQKVWFVFIAIAIITGFFQLFGASSSKTTNLEVHYPEELQEASKKVNTSSYKDEKYNYYEYHFTYEKDSTKCKFGGYATNKYNLTNSKKLPKELAEHYLNEKFSKKASVEEKTYNNLTYQHYYDPKYRVHYYIHIDKEELDTLEFTILSDPDKKCEEYMKYVLYNTTTKE